MADLGKCDVSSAEALTGHAASKGRRLLLAGAGHLGLPLAMLLARLPGIGLLRIIDRGRVRERHLRSEGFPPNCLGGNKAEAVGRLVAEVAEHLRIETFPADLEDVPHGVFDVDACLAGLDSLRARQLLINERAWPLGVPVIDGGLGDGTVGRVTVYEPQGACPECGWGPKDYQQLATEYPCLPGTTYAPPSTRSPAYVAAVVAGLMAAELERLFSAAEPAGSRECLCELPARFLHTRLGRAAACRFDHAVVAHRVRLPVAFAEATVGDLLQAAEERFAGQPIQLDFRRGLFGGEIFAASGQVVPGDLERQRGRRLAELGLDPQDLVRVRTAEPAQDAFLTFPETCRREETDS